MFLQQLVQFSGATERPYSRERTVRWELSLARDGSANLVDLADAADRRTRLGQSRLVPNAGRSSGIAPAIGADDIQYVLGWADEGSKPDRVRSAHVAFAELVARWAREYPDDATASALAAFYGTGGPATIAAPEARWASKDLAIIKVHGRYVTDQDSLWQLWSKVVEERKSGAAKGEAAREGLCLVCSRVGSLLNRMPQALPKVLVPRAEQEVALVSANKAIHTYDFSDGLATAPICTTCGQAAVANLNAILSDERHTFTYPRQRTRLAWWITGGGDPVSIEMLDADPDLIRDYLRSVVDGRRPRPLRDHEFCAVTVSGNVARLVVHDWIEMPLAAVEANVQRWFDDQRIAARWHDEPAYFPLWRLVSCAGQWQPNRDASTGRYIALFDKAADRPDDLAQVLWRSALHATPIPPYVLSHLVRRVRTDLRTDEARAALLRLALTRHPHRRTEPPMSALDDSRTDPPYLSGRLFAVIEALQRRAYRGAAMPNTTFYHRFYAGAVANPRVALIQGEQLAPAWIRKLEAAAQRGRDEDTDSSRDASAARFYKDRITDLFGRLRQTPPSRTTSEEQAMFILGYHHQRAHDLQRWRAIPSADGPDEDLARESDSS